MDGNAVVNWARYIAQIILTGDHNNEWLVQLPQASWDDIWNCGKWLSAWLGF